MDFMRFTKVFRAPDDAGGGAGTPPEKESFTKEYVAELRAEAKGYRLKAAELEAKLRAAEEQGEKAAQDAEARIAATVTAANDRIIRAELKAAAIQAGIVDPDALKLADLSKVALKEDGSVEGTGAALAELKKAKPYLFGAPNTSGTDTPPARTPPAPKRAPEMSKEEYAVARKKAIGGR